MKGGVAVTAKCKTDVIRSLSYYRKCIKLSPQGHICIQNGKIKLTMQLLCRKLITYFQFLVKPEAQKVAATLRQYFRLVFFN